MRFDWDENKRLINLQRHSIDFADVFLIFENPLVSKIDDRFDYGEIRFLTFALLFGDVIVVAHTEDDEKFRVISARKAEKYEQETYFNSIRN